MEEEFNKWMQFGLTAFIENDIQKFGYEKDSLFTNETLSTTKIGGILSKQRGRLFKYNVLGEIAMIGYKAGEFIHTFADAHIYNNHIEQLELQLSRDIRPLPMMKINPIIKNIEDFTFEDFELINYNPHPHIKGIVAV